MLSSLTTANMADSNSSVRISGFVLGSLMFQHFNSDSDVEGLILGESKAEARSNITDSQIDNIQFEHTINIQKHISCRKLNSFYNRIGEVNQDEVRYLLSNNKEENVIGWYKQRRNTDQQITFREQVVHENLKRALSNHELIFLLLTPSEVTSSGSTHKLEYAVYRSHCSQYRSVPVLVSNLGLLEQQDYWRLSASCSSVNYNRAVWKHRSRFFSLDGSLQEVDEINEMNNSLQVELKTACKKVEESERLVEELLEDVSSLRRTVSERKQEQKENGDSTPAQSQENVLLCEAIKTLFPGAALLQTQALTFQGFPVPEFCCNTDHGIDITTTLPLILTHTVPKARKGRLGRGGATSWRKHPLCESSEAPKRRKRMLEETEGSSLSVSGSETEEDLIPANQN
ncbi:BRCA1-A complex subunit Abraxas 1 isoform X2 [Coregonus clupeaformis]|uniref:BRCA1-A complex subunit Abraxas 1 isoform X2 n=1 Tax=Coregonus clupeaformis TaxID=59861 RepID=UPI001BE0BC3B|nr:BRCA1-A complex subunit Abraxas 1 isoform X2 [Coregonus clupeaformis]